MESYSVINKKSHQITKRHGGISNESYEVKDANMKSPYGVQFHLHSILEKTKLCRQFTGFQKLGRRRVA
jgi:hypothetical protein